MADRPMEVVVWGDWACFTRPENKVERVSYPVPTPSAVRGILEAIFWKPQFSWQVREIRVLKPIRYVSFIRNEVNSRESERVAVGWISSGGGFDAAADRAQRHTLALRDVAYHLRADIVVRPNVGEPAAKFRDQFRRRVARGQCFSRPYLGCREFSAEFSEPTGSERPIERTEDLGLMLLDLDYEQNGSGRGTPAFFAARLEAGVVHVPGGR